LTNPAIGKGRKEDGMQYIFERGALSQHQEDSIRDFLNSGYRHILLLKDLPPTEWRDNVFKIAEWAEDDVLVGVEQVRRSQLYGVSNLPEGEGRLLFLKFREDYDAVLRDFPELVISEKPLKSLLDLPAFADRDVLIEEMHTSLRDHRRASYMWMATTFVMAVAITMIFVASAT
jgi:hypothetical protein